MAWEIESELQKLGYNVRVAATEQAGLELARSGEPDLLIVDRMLCGVDSLSMISELRGAGMTKPVLFLSALADVDERIRALKAGGDDYLTKPFVMGELVARVEALLRRSITATATTILRAGPLELDLLARTARRGQQIIDLLPTEFKLLEYFMRRPGQTVTRAMLLEDVWHYRHLPQTNLVDVHVGKLRRKIDLGEEPSLIRSVRRTGFVFDVDAQS